MHFDPDDREWDEDFDAHVLAWYQMCAEKEVDRQLSEHVEVFIAEAGDEITDADLKNLIEAIDDIYESVAAEAGHGDVKLEEDPIFDALIGEARDLLRAGRNDEAAHRLRLLTHPKWASEQDCFAAYCRAMAEADPIYATPLAACLLNGYAP
jgi:hypothetical protein